jgi:hypothetical protein
MHQSPCINHPTIHTPTILTLNALRWIRLTIQGRRRGLERAPDSMDTGLREPWAPGWAYQLVRDEAMFPSDHDGMTAYTRSFRLFLPAWDSERTRGVSRQETEECKQVEGGESQKGQIERGARAQESSSSTASGYGGPLPTRARALGALVLYDGAEAMPEERGLHVTVHEGV